MLTAWHPIESWCGRLRREELDAALISVAGMSVPPRTRATRSRAGGRSAAGLWLDPALCGPDITAIPLGRRPLVLIHANDRQAATDPAPNPKARRPWLLLLPPAEHQPLLWRQLERLALLPLREYRAVDSESWLQELLQGPHLLPAPLSLLEEAPWSDAGLKAVPPPEPLGESLWLLVRQEAEAEPLVKKLAGNIRSRFLEGNGSPP